MSLFSKKKGLPQEINRKNSILDDINLTPEQIQDMNIIIERNVKCDECGGSVTATYETKEVKCNDCGKLQK